MTATTTAPIALKIDMMFHSVDGNGDGYAEWSDFDAIVGRSLLRPLQRLASDGRVRPARRTRLPARPGPCVRRDTA